MSLFDLTSLPLELQATLQRLLPDEESRRRAVLAPWVAAQGQTIATHTWPWVPWQRFWRAHAAANTRALCEQWLASRLNPHDPASPSVFDPALPYFPCPQTRVTRVLNSPWPSIFTDAEFWALTMQLFDGEPDTAQRVLTGWVHQCQAQKHLAAGQSLSASERRALLREIWQLETARQSGNFA